MLGRGFYERFHRLAGHMAQISMYDTGRDSCRTMAWKGYQNLLGLEKRNKGRQMHVRCFEAWRWERQLCKFWGKKTDGMTEALDRVTWESRSDEMVQWRLPNR